MFIHYFNILFVFFYIIYVCIYVSGEFVFSPVEKNKTKINIKDFFSCSALACLCLLTVFSSINAKKSGGNTILARLQL